MIANRRTLLLVARVGCLALLAGSLHAAQPHRPKPPMEIPVVVVKYFPVKGDRIDIGVTGDWGAPLKQTREKTDKLTAEVAKALQEGSRYHAYKNPRAKPSLVYRILRTIEYLEPLPTVPRPGRKVPNTDYNKIMERIGIRRWVEQKGVKQVWIWGYHGGGGEPLGVEHGRALGRHQQQQPGPQRPARAEEDVHRVSLQLPAGSVGGGRRPHAPDRGGAEPRRRARPHGGQQVARAVVLGQVRRQRSDAQDRSPGLRSRPSSVPRIPAGPSRMRRRLARPPGQETTAPCRPRLARGCVCLLRCPT